MASSSSTNNISRPLYDASVLGDVNSVIDSLNELTRLMLLATSFGEKPQTRSLVQKTLLTLFKREYEAEAFTKGLKRCPQKVVDLYASIVDQEGLTSACQELEVMANQSVLINNPAVKSRGGIAGPTFLVGYTNFNPSRAKNGLLNAYVIKFTVLDEELVANRIYEVMGGEAFKVPRSSGFNLDKMVHEKVDGTRGALKQAEVVALKTHLQGLLKIFEAQWKNPDVMLSEKVNGENGFDFITKQFISLNDSQKEALFKGFGKMAIMDLLFANTDRFLPVMDGKLQGIPSNLGNVMVRFKSNGNIALFAIDNGFDQQVIGNPSQQAAYLKLLHDLFSSENGLEQIANEIVYSIEAGLDALMDEIKEGDKPPQAEELKQMEGALKAFKASLQGEGKDWILKGLTDVGSQIENKGDLLLNSDKFDGLRRDIDGRRPDLLPYINKALGIFALRKKK